MNPRVSAEFTGDDARVLHAIEARDRQVVRVRGLRGAAARSLRGPAGGHARGGARARAAVPRGRGGPRRDRRAAHVQPRRRGRQGRRLHHLGHRRRPVRRREAPGPDRGGGRTAAVASLVDAEPARRLPRRDRCVAVPAVEVAKLGRVARVWGWLQTQRTQGFGRRSQGFRRRSQGFGRRRSQGLGWRREGRRRWPTIEASAPWPQRRTAPFRCQGRLGQGRHLRPTSHVRNRQDRRQAVPRRGGPVPARRAAAR